MSTINIDPLKELAAPSQRSRARIDLTNLLIHFAFVLLSAAFVVPLLLVLSASFTDEKTISRVGYSLFPTKFSTFAYEFILRDPSQVIQSYGISIFVTVVGSAISLFVMALLAYPLSA